LSDWHVAARSGFSALFVLVSPVHEVGRVARWAHTVALASSFRWGFSGLPRRLHPTIRGGPLMVEPIGTSIELSADRPQ